MKQNKRQKAASIQNNEKKKKNIASDSSAIHILLLRYVISYVFEKVSREFNQKKQNKSNI